MHISFTKHERHLSTAESSASHLTALKPLVIDLALVLSFWKTKASCAKAHRPALPSYVPHLAS